MHGQTNQRLIGVPNFYMHMWFWTCLDDEAFTLFSVGPSGKATSETLATDSQHFSFGVQGDGYIYFEIRMYDDTIPTEILYRETTTTLKVQKGWNYIGFHLDEIYEYSYMTIYLRNEGHVGTYSKYETFFKGYYYKNYWNSLPSTDADEIVVLGCKTYTNWPNTASWLTPNIFPDPVYGLCMQGWIHTIEIWTTRDNSYFDSAKWNRNWDFIFNADLETRTQFETNFVE